MEAGRRDVLRGNVVGLSSPPHWAVVANTRGGLEVPEAGQTSAEDNL